jgi:hypothetical protein
MAASRPIPAGGARQAPACHYPLFLIHDAGIEPAQLHLRDGRTSCLPSSPSAIPDLKPGPEIDIELNSIQHLNRR